MDMNILEKENLFWSRLGFEVDPPICGEDGKLISAGYDYEHFASLHKKMFDCGIKVHTSILHSGWVGPDRYDYRESLKIIERSPVINKNLEYSK